MMERINKILTASVRCFCSLALLGFAAVPGMAYGKECVDVYYPEVRRPYSDVIDEIISGVENGTSWKIKRRVIDETLLHSTAITLVDACAVAIGLGRGGMTVVKAQERPHVVGAVYIQPGEGQETAGISLVPEQEEIFKRLKHFVPYVTTVYVVYNASNSRRYVDDAVVKAEEYGLTLVTLEAENLHESIRVYTRVFETANVEHSAIWLLHDDSVLDSETILPLVLTEAWKKRLVVFSNQLVHVRNGVLFSVYPNNDAMGKRLGRLAQECAVTGCRAQPISLLRDLNTAVNTRTAERLRVRIRPRGDPYVTLMFPRR